MRARAGWAPVRIMVAAGAVAVAGVLWLPAVECLGAASVHRPPALSAIVIPEIGFGYTVTSQGPLDASRFPTGSPSASAAAGALSSLGHTIATYQRSWSDGSGVNQVQDVVIRFPTDAGARAFIGAARRALARSEIVSMGPLRSIPGAQRTTYFASTSQAGVGQTITMRVDSYAAVLSFFSGASGNLAPITTESAQRVAKAQYTGIVAAVASTKPRTAKRTP